jgi:hypothetical protein
MMLQKVHQRPPLFVDLGGHGGRLAKLVKVVGDRP